MNRVGAHLPRPATVPPVSTVHVLGKWEPVAAGISVRRCTNCNEAQFVRFTGDTVSTWHHDGDRIRVHGNGQRERTDGAVTCAKEAA